jgi:aminoglycoside phosphotransferase family enzyme/predicted kinase
VSEADPEELKAALERLSRGPVEVRETHISWVFLAAKKAYKLKKPLVLPFLDYGTPRRRRKMCAEEVRLNRRLAPGLYLGVRSVARAASRLRIGSEATSGAIDYLVEMRRYEEAHTMAATIDRGELTRRQIEQVARKVARFHAKCRRVSLREKGSRRVRAQVERNLEELLAVAEPHAERDRIHGLGRLMDSFIAARREDFDARAKRGLIKDCHGDLRAEHVVLEPRLSVVDCVEFDRGLRTLDVADDLAFLVMDLAALRGERLAAHLVDSYRAAGGDCGDDGLLSFFAVHRALVHAKVLLLRATQHPPESSAHGHASARGRELLAVAERFAWRARLPLSIVVCGVPASGKSYLAAALARMSGLPRVSSDLARKELAGLEPTEAGSSELYSDDFNRATYGELGRRAAKEAMAHGGVLVDATFRHRRDRDAFRKGFSNAAPLVLLECQAPAEVLRRRAAVRERDPAGISDATAGVVEREREAWGPLDEVAARRHLALRTDRDVEQVAAEALAWLDKQIRRWLGREQGRRRCLS